MKNLGIINDNKSLVTKEYSDANYASSSEMATLSEKIRVANLLADESNFKSEANFRAINYGLDCLCIESFEDTEDIDSTSLDGAYVIENFYDADNHRINKTSSDTRTIQSRKFRVDNTPREAIILLDSEGTGTINLYFSKNDGDDWTPVSNDTLTSLNLLIQKDVRVKIEMVGVVIINNIAWGCK